MNATEALAAFRGDKAHLEELGIAWQPGTEPIGYVTPEMKRDYRIAMDALPTLTTDPNSGVPAMLTTLIDPNVYEVLFAANKAAVILGELRKGTWLDQTAMFPVAEATGETSTYGDFNENGRAGVNTNWPQRQAYLFQIIKEYGELELERAGLARINWVSEIDKAAALNLNKFANLTYFRGVSGLQNYGLLNDPNLSASITPATKAAGGVTWFSGTSPNATANEVYNDILATYTQLVVQTAGLVEMDTPLKLALGTTNAVAMKFINTFGLTVADMLDKTFPNLKIESAVQYNALSTQNTQGNPAGNLMQLIADNVEGQATGFCAFNEKMRSHPIIRATSSFKQKVTAGTWGAVLRFPAGIASMVGI
jgi:hypothetical protein